MNWQETRERLLADKGRWSHISRQTGLHINTVRNIALGETPTPGIATVEKIIAYYEQSPPVASDQPQQPEAA